MASRRYVVSARRQYVLIDRVGHAPRLAGLAGPRQGLGSACPPPTRLNRFGTIPGVTVPKFGTFSVLFPLAEYSITSVTE